MRSQFAQYYARTSDDLDAAVRSATVVIDTNVLFDLYRRTPDARNERLNVLTQLGERLWIPHQVGLEFHRRRADVIGDLPRAYTQARAHVDAMEKALVGFSGDHYIETKSLVTEAARDAAKALRERLDALEANDEHTLEPGDDEPLLTRIAALLEGRVGTAPTPRQIRKRVARFANYRLPSHIPPGYMDAQKVAECGMQAAAGDYLLWREMLEYARTQDRRALVFVTQDMKTDWWDRGRKGQPNRPRPELVAEFSHVTGADYFQVTVEDLLRRARRVLKADVTEDVLAEEARASAEDRQGAIVETHRSELGYPTLVAAFAGLDITAISATQRVLAETAAKMAASLDLAGIYASQRVLAETAAKMAASLDLAGVYASQRVLAETAAKMAASLDLAGTYASQRALMESVSQAATAFDVVNSHLALEHDSAQPGPVSEPKEDEQAPPVNGERDGS